jgi:sulfate adenylyltransferase subunit 1
MTSTPRPLTAEQLSATTLLRFATAGSVDDGKSTLVGRLLHDSKSVLTDQLEAVERVSLGRGQAVPDLALLTATSPPPAAASSWPTRRGTCSTPATW